MSAEKTIRVSQRISTLLLAILTLIAGLVLIGLFVMTFRLVRIQGELGDLRNSALPRLMKLSQLSQEAAATISIAPALSANPTHFEFETLLSRIADKQASHAALLAELDHLIRDAEAAAALHRNGDLVMDNLRKLTNVVREQIDVRRRLEKDVEFFRRIAQRSNLSGVAAASTSGSGVDTSIAPVSSDPGAGAAAYSLLNLLLDPARARFSRNRAAVGNALEALRSARQTQDVRSDPGAEALFAELRHYWKAQRARMLDDKAAELSNDFKIKALVGENSLLANRLLSSAGNEFLRASNELEAQIGLADNTARFTVAAILVVVVMFAAGNVLVWFVLKRRIFWRLDRIRDALADFAESRRRLPEDPRVDEIGAISQALTRYMAVIDVQEAELAKKTQAMEQLSNQLAKYLSPQVYDSIFSGKQEVKVASSRKKLTVFFSDVAGFTEATDRLESEELTQLLNHYLTEMSRIALDHGATIDKYVGDAIVIFFGDPESKGIQEDALACVRMAIAMRERMRDLEGIWRRSGIERPLQVRMGIHTGFCTVGNFGSEDRLDYTIIGGAVNTAARLETAAAPGEILISYETFAQVRDQIACEEHGEIEVKGLAYPVATYLVRDAYDRLHQRHHRLREEHGSMKLDLDLEAMTASDRQQAARALRRALALLSESAPAGEAARRPK